MRRQACTSLCSTTPMKKKSAPAMTWQRGKTCLYKVKNKDLQVKSWK
jgi:hypothetical protein